MMTMRTIKALPLCDNRIAGILATLSLSLLRCSAILTATIVTLITADVLARSIFNFPIRGVPELVAVVIPAAVFLALGQLFVTNKLIRADMLSGFITKRWPTGGATLSCVFHLGGAAVALMIAIPATRGFIFAINTGEFLGVEGDFTVPVWPAKLAVVVGSSLVAVLSATAAATIGRSLLGANNDTPHTLASVVIIFGAILASLAVLFQFGIDDRTYAGIGSCLLIFALIYLGMPVAFALALAATIGIALIKGSAVVAVEALALVAEGAVANYVFAAVPLFVLMGLIVGAADIGRDSLQAAHWLLRRIKGGLGVATVSANAIFAAITGISIASATIFSRIAVPSLIESGFTPRFSVGLVAGSSVLGMLIPPSLLLIVYGLVAEVSINKLFLAAIVPGLLLASAFSIGVILVATFKPRFAMSGIPSVGLRQQINGRLALRKTLPIAALIVIVLGGIYGGIFTPTEAGAIGSVAASAIALAMRRITLGSLVSLAVEAAASSASILFLIVCASVFALMLTLSGIPALLSEQITNADLNLNHYVMAYLAVLVVLGMVLDSTSIILIMVPLALPTIQAFGGDLVWFGVVTVIGVEIGLLTPPLGLSAYAIKASLEDPSISLNDIFIGALPFTLIMLALTLLLIAYPQLCAVI
ncbi:MAG: C4-dicarboxylate transporter DctM subunit [Gammaproteobacteria bacterium]|jgi:C4-dicarboxylate transporter DctM subunit